MANTATEDLNSDIAVSGRIALYQRCQEALISSGYLVADTASGTITINTSAIRYMLDNGKMVDCAEINQDRPTDAEFDRVSMISNNPEVYGAMQVQTETSRFSNLNFLQVILTALIINAVFTGKAIVARGDVDNDVLTREVARKARASVLARSIKQSREDSMEKAKTPHVTNSRGAASGTPPNSSGDDASSGSQDDEWDQVRGQATLELGDQIFGSGPIDTNGDSGLFGSRRAGNVPMIDLKESPKRPRKAGFPKSRATVHPFETRTVPVVTVEKESDSLDVQLAIPEVAPDQM